MIYYIIRLYIIHSSNQFKVCLGLPGDVPAGFKSQLFWCGIVTIGSIFRRLVRPYRRPPFCFALLVDPCTPTSFKERLARFVMQMPECCLDSGFTGPLRDQISCQDGLLSSNGIGVRILEGAFMSKNHNVQVENNFARASSWQRTNRGRTDRSYNLISKHLLAEVKHNHLKAQQREHQPVMLISELSGTTAAIENGAAEAIEDQGSGFIFLFLFL